MIVDILQPRWAGTIIGNVRWNGDIILDGDLTIAPEGRLILGFNTRVRVASGDRLRSGEDPTRCEVYVQGEIEIERDSRSHRYNKETRRWEKLLHKPVVFEPLVPGETWYGIIVIFDAGGSRIMRRLTQHLELRDSLYGLLSLAELSELRSRATAILSDPTSLPETVKLLPNYPNPFNTSTTIRYELASTVPVRLQVYDALGQIVRSLEDGHQPAGVQTIVWDGRDEHGLEAAGGIYFIQLRAGQQVQTSKLSLLR